jgi:phospholipid/cholesterol/gamma-HCH transport system substrate-binding protein
MPGTSKVRWAQLKVGLMAILAFAILAYLVFLMSSTLGFFKSKSQIYTFMDDSQAVATGVDVTLNGIKIGTVSDVRLSGMTQPGRTVKITMDVDNQFLPSVPVDSQAKLAAANLLGTKYINIKKGMSPQAIQPGAEVSSGETKELEDLFEQGSTTLAAMETIVKRLDAIVSQVELGKGNLGKIIQDDKLYNNAVQITDEINSLTADFHKMLNSSDNSVGKLLNDKGAMYDDLRTFTASTQKIVDGINDGKGTLGQLLQNPAMFDDFRQILADTHQLLAGLNAGEGTAGKFLRSDELHNQISGLLTRTDALLEKVNNGPGTISRLLNDPSLFEDLDGMMRETQGLMKDIRGNPKKFLRIKLGLF